jgi:hypothetical protein
MVNLVIMALEALNLELILVQNLAVEAEEETPSLKKLKELINLMS